MLIDLLLTYIVTFGIRQAVIPDPAEVKLLQTVEVYMLSLISQSVFLFLFFLF